MPNQHAAIKDLRKNHRRAKVNLRIKTHIKSLHRSALDLIGGKKISESKAAIQTFQQAVDKAAKRNILSRNAAARKKSALAQALKKATV
jgi:small subunit ribosomal protein S20